MRRSDGRNVGSGKRPAKSSDLRQRPRERVNPCRYESLPNEKEADKRGRGPILGNEPRPLLPSRRHGSPPRKLGEPPDPGGARRRGNYPMIPPGAEGRTDDPEEAGQEKQPVDNQEGEGREVEGHLPAFPAGRHPVGVPPGPHPKRGGQWQAGGGRARSSPSDSHLRPSLAEPLISPTGAPNGGQLVSARLGAHPGHTTRAQTTHPVVGTQGPDSRGSLSAERGPKPVRPAPTPTSVNCVRHRRLPARRP